MKISNGVKVIIGLGNPGKKYALTRHNAGFIISEKIIKDLDFSQLEEKKKLFSLASSGILGKEKTVIVLPQTFMNNSGKTAAKALAYFPKSDLFVIHDDIDIELGKYKIQKNRSSAGHKGVQSIIDSLGTKDFYRIRVGINTPLKKTETDRFVLQKFSKKELAIVDSLAGEIVKKIESIV